MWLSSAGPLSHPSQLPADTEAKEETEAMPHSITQYSCEQPSTVTAASVCHMPAWQKGSLKWSQELLKHCFKCWRTASSRGPCLLFTGSVSTLASYKSSVPKLWFLSITCLPSPCPCLLCQTLHHVSYFIDFPPPSLCLPLLPSSPLPPFFHLLNTIIYEALLGKMSSVAYVTEQGLWHIPN